jgi:hypothetical protein
MPRHPSKSAIISQLAKRDIVNIALFFVQIFAYSPIIRRITLNLGTLDAVKATAKRWIALDGTTAQETVGRIGNITIWLLLRLSSTLRVRMLT